MLVHVGTLILFALPTSFSQYCQLPPPYTSSFGDEHFGCIQRSDIHIITITHGGQHNSFWDVVEDAVLRAGNDLRIKSSYRTTSSANDYLRMAQLIYDATLEEPDGLVISIPDIAVLEAPVKSAVAAGIPVITINAGSDAFESLGALHHVGQVEIEAGYLACKRILAINPQIKAILIPDVNNLMDDVVNDRSIGCIEAAVETGANVSHFGASTRLDLHTATLLEHILILTGLYNSSQIGIITMTILSVEAAVSVATTMNFPENSLTIGTFDFSESVESYLTGGFLSFAVHQQQYLQGYLPVAMLTIYASTKNIFAKSFDANGKQIPLSTGPIFITKDDLPLMHQRICEMSGIIYCDDPLELGSFMELKYTRASATTKCPCIDRSKVSMGFVHHGGHSSSFWWVVQNGALQAANDMGVNLNLQTPMLSDNIEMLALALGLVDESPQIAGLVMTIPDSIFQAVVRKANSKNIPVIAINAGLSEWEAYGALMFIGQEDYMAGY